jgi:hypothetical protein
VNPIIGAALISGGWAAVVAAIGFQYNRVIAKATIKATNANALTALDAAHEAQMWEKKAETYVGTLAALHRRQLARFNLLRLMRLDATTEEQLRQAAEPPPDTDWATDAARLKAFAPHPVADAFWEANKANNEFNAKGTQYRVLFARATASAPGAPTGSQIAAARQAAKDAGRAADAADKALEALIRDDLALRPSRRAAPAPAEAPASPPRPLMVIQSRPPAR